MGDVTARIGLGRVALSAGALRRELAGPGGILSSLEVLPQCRSTNTALRRQAAALADLAVLATDHQTAGVGRLSRAWLTPPRTALTWSLLLRPVGADPWAWGWLPLLTGLALTDVLRGAGLDAVLKWPNDVLVADPERGIAKVAGILCEALPAQFPAMVIGVGVNVSQQRDELPPTQDSDGPGNIGPDGARPHRVEQADAGALPSTSLALAGAATVDRDQLLLAMIRHLVDLVGQWREQAGDVRGAGLADRVRARTLTVGSEVTVHLPGGATLRGLATAIDDAAQLVVRTREGTTHAVNAGDVVHVRSGP